MSREAAGWAKLVAGMKRAAKRKADESDSDDSIEQLTNRGNKLRKNARFVREGQLAPPSGPKAYKRSITFYHDRPNGTIEHFNRDIISVKPKLYDEEGFEIDSEEDEDGEAHARASESYPYADIRLEELFAPLASIADLPNHPTLARPFTSNTLTDLTRHASEMMHKEKASLWRMKNLLTKLSGDHTWIPCGMLETDDDMNFFADLRGGYKQHMQEKERVSNELVADAQEALENRGVDNGDGSEQSDPDATVELQDDIVGEDDVVMVDASAQDPQASELHESAVPAMKRSVQETKPDTEATNIEIGGSITVVHETTKSAGATDLMEDKSKAEKTLQETSNDGPPKSADDQEGGTDGEVVDEEDNPAPHRMRTRAQAQAISEPADNELRSTTPESNESYVHPIFLPPRFAIPDRDIGLPQQEAEETRRLLQLYIQKQEEICRGAQKLYDGLLKADRLRKLVMRWAKAEGHTQESGNGMSDGEDWYDKEEWGLTEDLKKGQDEEEEDAATTAKKTRTRRQ